MRRDEIVRAKRHEQTHWSARHGLLSYSAMKQFDLPNVILNVLILRWTVETVISSFCWNFANELSTFSPLSVVVTECSLTKSVSTFSNRHLGSRGRRRTNSSSSNAHTHTYRRNTLTHTEGETERERERERDRARVREHNSATILSFHQRFVLWHKQSREGSNQANQQPTTR